MSLFQMDLRKAAHVRREARYGPPKTILTSFAKILECKDIENMPKFVEDLLISIDSAKEEFYVLNSEIEMLKSLPEKWKAVSEEMNTLSSTFDERIFELRAQKEELDGLYDEIEQIKDFRYQEKLQLREKKENQLENLQNELSSLQQRNSERIEAFRAALLGWKTFYTSNL